MSRVPSVAAAVFTVLLAATSPSQAQELADRSPRIAANLALGVAGELDSQLGDSRFEVDLDASVGFNLRFELPVLDFLVVGGMFELLTLQPDSSGSEREETVSFDGYLRARWVFEVADGLFLEPYAMLPLGFTMAVLPDDDGSGDDIWPGWNIAALFGAQFLHESGFGGYLEIGWRHAEVYIERTFFGATVDYALTLNELALNFGFVYAFGS